MKKYFFSLVVFCSLSATPLSAQIEIGANPLGLLFNNPDLSLEYVVFENFGLELTTNINYGRTIFNRGLGFDLIKNGYRFRLAGKYYFDNDLGADRWFSGIYFGPRRLRSTEIDSLGNTFVFTERYFALGFNGGFKWVGENGFIFEINGGLGRAFNNGSDPDRTIFSSISTASGIDIFSTVKIGIRL